VRAILEFEYSLALARKRVEWDVSTMGSFAVTIKATRSTFYPFCK
jgi:hypothetical protein